MARQRRLGMVRISRELLLEALKLPPGTEVVGLSHDVFFTQDQFALMVEHPSLPATMEGAHAVEVNPRYRRAKNGRVSFAGWGHPFDAGNPNQA